MSSGLSSSSSTATYCSAERLSGGVCRGTLSLAAPTASGSGGGSSASASLVSSSSTASATFTTYYCELVGHVLYCYETAVSYQRGDAPVAVWETVGSAPTSDTCSFRLVTTHSTTVTGRCHNESDRSCWLAALQTGLEGSLASKYAYLPRNRSQSGTKETPKETAPTGGGLLAKASFFRSNSSVSSNRCVVCQTTVATSTTIACVPVGYETRQTVCGDCSLQEGWLDYLWKTHTVQQCAAAETECIQTVRKQCAKLLQQQQQQSQSQQSNSNSGSSTSATTATTTEEDVEWTQVGLAPDYVHLESAEWQHYLQSSPFQQLARQCPALQELLLQEDNNSWELLQELSGVSVAAELKKQAFTVAAADMGTALQLLQEQCFAGSKSNNSNCNTVVLQAVLEFLWKLCQTQHALPSVAFFWPQLCHLHLRLLAVAVSSGEQRRCQLLGDFLMAVATKCSIHLALELVWSHVADLEASLPATGGGGDLCKAAVTLKEGPSASTLTTTPATTTSAPEEAASVPPHCRRRRFAVLQFVCELESLLFDFEGGWGGGRVALGHLVNFRGSMALRLGPMARAVLQQRSSISAQSSPFLNNNNSNDKSPDEKLRVARNADYFSSHISFSKRLADVAETLRGLEVADRAAYLQDALSNINGSCALGGDPLNRVRPPIVADNTDHQPPPYLTRVVRIPPTEGHVFRSKERTPVLLLVEVVDEEIAAQVVEDEEPSFEPPPRSNSKTSVEPASTSTKPATTATDSALPVETQGVEEEDEKAATTTTTPATASSVAAGELSAQTTTTTTSADEATPEDERESSGSPHPPSSAEGEDDDLLHPSRNSPGPKALKRFDPGAESSGTSSSQEAPTTPKHDIQQMLNNVAQEQLKDIVIPDISRPDGAVGTVEYGGRGRSAQQHDQSSDAASTDNTHAGAESANTTEKPSASSVAVSKERSGSITKRINTLGNLAGERAGADACATNNNTLAPTGDIRRAVLTTIMMRGLQGNTIAAGAADSVQRSLQDLERKRATELLLSDDELDINADDSDAAKISATDRSKSDSTESTRQKMESLGLSPSLDEVEFASRPSEEDECMEAIRLMLIQNRVAQGQLSPADAAKVLQYTSLSPSNKRRHTRIESFDGPEAMDLSDHPTIDAGDVDPRLVGCGALPPAVLQALTLWKGGMVSHAELLELVKKDIEFVKHSILVDAESVDKLKENSAFWGRFAFGERWAEKKARIGSSSPEGSVPGWDLMGVIVKSNDDLRQEAFVMQLIELSAEAFEMAGLELWVSPYRILATGRTTGIIECVRNAMSFDALKKRPGYGKGGLREHLQRMTEFTADPGGAFKTAQQNFVRSLAAYSLLSYIFLFKDRHNGNLLLDTAAHVVHIDFGFVFGIAPGGSFSLEMSTPFKLTEEMLDVMGGLRSPLFSEFVTLFCCGFLALQQHCDTFMTIVEITSKESTFPCFEGRDSEKVVAELRERFAPDLSKEDTVSFALDLIKQATTSYGTRQYDLFQYLSQGIVA